LRTGGSVGRVRTLVVAAAVVVAALAAGCTAGSEPATSDTRPSPTSTPDVPDVPEESDVPVVDSEACEEVRTGIDAFNAGDYDGTVEHFEAALPLAQERDDGSTMASDLIEAVRYYAALAPEVYPKASLSSPEFAKYKAITLGQCVPVGSDAPESPGTNV
jgi:hypothetical protein